MESEDGRQYAPATERNRELILAVLQRVLPPDGTVLEVASGTGEHGVFFAPRLQPRVWQPSDPNPMALRSIAAWREHLPAENLRPPVLLDASLGLWPVETGEVPLVTPIRAIVNINMIHISPWSACLGLMAGAQRILPPGGILYLYGPFKQGGKHTAPSNQQFDEMLRAQDPAWGVRNLDEVIAVAAKHGLHWKETIAMPANNLSAVWERVMGDG